MYTIYSLVDPRDYITHYVGITIDVYYRFKQHLSNSDVSNPEKNSWIRDVLASGYLPLMPVLEKVRTKKEAEKRERYWIQFYLSLNMPLTNIKSCSCQEPPQENKNGYGKIESKRDAVARALESNPVASLAEIAQMARCSEKTAAKWLADLQR